MKELAFPYQQIDQKMDLVDQNGTQPKIHIHLMKNRIFEVNREIESNPNLLIENLNLLERARTPLMVQTLLQLNKFRKKLQKYDREVNLEGVTEQSGDVIIKAVKTSFPFLIARWPEIALQVLDAHIQYKG